LFRNGLARSDNRKIVEEAAQEATGHPVQLDVGIAEDSDGELERVTQEEKKTAERDSLMSRALQEPIVRTFMDRFGGSVVRIEENSKP
jgi:hypothetical protein